MKRELTLRVDDREIVVQVHREGERIVVEHESERHEILVTSDRPSGVVPPKDDSGQPAPAAAKPASAPPHAATKAAAGTTPVLAPMVGVVREVHTTAGSSVAEGEKLVTMEAMKMDIFVLAPVGGTLASLSCSVGQTVQEGHTVATIAPSTASSGPGA